MRTQQQNQSLRAATREAIELAAVRVFARHGFAASSIRQIADEAGLSVGSIYRHHATKEALFDSLLERASSGFAGASAALRSDGDPLTRARAFTHDFLADLVGNHGAAEFYLVINQAFLTDTPSGTAERMATAQQSLWDAFADVVRRGQTSGQFASGDPFQLTAYYFAMLSGIATMRAFVQDSLTEIGVDVVLRLLTDERQP